MHLLVNMWLDKPNLYCWLSKSSLSKCQFKDNNVLYTISLMSRWKLELNADVTSYCKGKKYLILYNESVFWLYRMYSFMQRPLNAIIFCVRSGLTIFYCPLKNNGRIRRCSQTWVSNFLRQGTQASENWMCTFCVKKWNKIHYHRGVDAILVYLSDSLPLIENKARVQKISHCYES